VINKKNSVSGPTPPGPPPPPPTPVVDASNYDLVVADLASPAAEIAFIARSEMLAAPCLFLSRSSAYDRALLLRSGACDIVSPSTHPVELIYRIRSHVARHRREVHWARRSRQLGRESRTDELTGLPNRRLLDEVLHREFERARRHGMPMTAVMADLDGFKSINDSLGHTTGDTVLRELARALTGTLRATDIAGRYGGDEFLAILSNTDRDGAAVFAERWRRTVGDLDVPVQDGRSVQLSMSIGVAEVDQRMVTPEALVQAADVELYRAKGAPIVAC
jgi:diguanylate cyclase (GGDEF)-like protein